MAFSDKVEKVELKTNDITIVKRHSMHQFTENYRLVSMIGICQERLRQSFPYQKVGRNTNKRCHLKL